MQTGVPEAAPIHRLHQSLEDHQFVPVPLILIHTAILARPAVCETTPSRSGIR